MKSRSLGKLRKLGSAAAILCITSCLATNAGAELANTVTRTEAAGSLIMPFDSTKGKASFQIVSRIGAKEISGSIATHWVYYSTNCQHLVDVFICLTPQDTVVVDPTALQAEFQKGSTNVGIGPVVDLSGQRGLLVVTAYAADSQCRAIPEQQINEAIFGSWTIANTTTNTGYGADAIGFPVTGVFPDAGVLADGLKIPTYAPDSLTDSMVIVLPIRYPQGSGAFSNEIGPLNRVSCHNTFYDNIETESSLPSSTLRCANFNPISAATAVEGGDPPIIPDTFTLDTSGFLQMNRCETSSGPLSGTRFIFAFHAQGLGPFGTVASGKYTRILPD